MKGYNVLKYGATGVAAPDMSAYDKLMALRMHGSLPITTITGIPPISFKSDGHPLTVWSIAGNSRQDGTPAPDNPIMPDFVGERTRNLLPLTVQTQTINGVTFTTNPTTGTVTVNGTPILAQDTIFNCPIPENLDGDFYMSGCHDGGSYATYDVYVWDFTATARVRKWDGTTQSDADFGQGNVEIKLIAGHTTSVIIRTRYGVQYNNLVFRPMIRVPSASPDFEPYGYKLPIISANQTVPVYLGQVQTVRRVKKLVLTGAENYGTSGGNTWLILGTSAADFRGTAGGAICSHLPLVLCSNFTTNTCAWGGGQIGDFLINIDNKNMAELKQYIAQQYSDGTPVTIWYVLAETETGIINEPLAKIGDYADTLNSEQTGIVIPTARGSNSLSVGTDLQPSEMSITGHIKSV